MTVKTCARMSGIMSVRTPGPAFRSEASVDLKIPAFTAFSVPKGGRSSALGGQLRTLSMTSLLFTGTRSRCRSLA